MKKEMKQQRKNKIPRIASLALMLTMVTTCLLSGTLAKYTKTVYGADTARVAKFEFGASITANGTTTPITGTTTASATPITLFKTAYSNAAAPSVKTVESNGADEIVAPGTSGYFSYEFSGQSEVSVKLAIDISEANTGNIPIFYEYGGQYYANDAAYTHYTGLSSLSASGTTTNLWIEISDGSGTGSHYTELTSSNFGGQLDKLAVNSATAISDKISNSVGGVISPNTNLATASLSLTATEKQVTWHWPYEVATSSNGNNSGSFTVISDTIDTTLGTNTVLDTITLDMKATATQVD